MAALCRDAATGAAFPDRLRRRVVLPSVVRSRFGRVSVMLAASVFMVELSCPARRTAGRTLPSCSFCYQLQPPNVSPEFSQRRLPRRPLEPASVRPRLRRSVALPGLVLPAPATKQHSCVSSFCVPSVSPVLSSRERKPLALFQARGAYPTGAAGGKGFRFRCIRQCSGRPARKRPGRKPSPSHR